MCVAGYGRTSISSPCEICPIGWYQPDEANQPCISCGTGATTMAQGTQNENECSKYIVSQKNLPKIDINVKLLTFSRII